MKADPERFGWSLSDGMTGSVLVFHALPAPSTEEAIEASLVLRAPSS